MLDFGVTLEQILPQFDILFYFILHRPLLEFKLPFPAQTIIFQPCVKWCKHKILFISIYSHQNWAPLLCTKLNISFYSVLWLHTFQHPWMVYSNDIYLPLCHILLSAVIIRWRIQLSKKQEALGDWPFARHLLFMLLWGRGPLALL